MKYLLLLTLFACGSAQLAPSSDRIHSEVIKTKYSKTQNYSKAMTYFAQSYGNAKKAIISKDSNSGTIIADGNVTCNVFRQTGDINNYSLAYRMTFNSKNKKIRLKYEDLRIINNLGENVGWSYNQLTSKSDSEKAIKKCLKPLISDIKKSITVSDNW
jgi:hypothetical protein